MYIFYNDFFAYDGSRVKSYMKKNTVTLNASFLFHSPYTLIFCISTERARNITRLNVFTIFQVSLTCLVAF